jgi:preprotein translocase subunit YajC
VSEAEITVVWIAGILLITWFFFIRPRRRMMSRQRDLLSDLSAGDEVVTVGGVYGTIAGVDDDVIRLEIAPDVIIRVARRAIAGRAGAPSEVPAEELGPAEQM